MKYNKSMAQTLAEMQKKVKEQETDPVAKAQDNLEKQKKIADLKKQIDTVKNEKLDQDDAPAVKDLVKNLRKGSKTHAKQADDLEKELEDETDLEEFSKSLERFEYS